MASIEIRKASITDLDTDAIVNAANEGLKAGGGVCGAIFKAAGHSKLQAACNKIGHCNTGSAVITPGFNLKAKYVIHAVGPVWKGGNHGEDKLLYGAYRRSLELAAEHGCTSIGFPLISAGIFGCPVPLAWKKALQACADFLDQGHNLRIVFAVLADDVLQEGMKARKHVNPDYLVAVKSDWKTVQMPAQHEAFVLNRPITREQIQTLRKGHLPRQMEDKWFFYMEGNTLYAHRSWTGICIYVVELSPTGQHQVTVNRDPEQYKCKDANEDKVALNKLLSWWTGTSYDPYAEWISETVNTLANAGAIREKLLVAGHEVEAVFFHLPSEPYGYLSNWYPSDFDLDGIHYTSTEQYIMHAKCTLFGDQASAAAVLATNDPAGQQAIGRQASGFVPKVWEGMRQLVAIRGLTAKFTQNDSLRQKLLATGDAWLVECAYSDTTWACGRRLHEDERRDVSLWRGQNILGFALMNVRDALRAAK